MSGKQWKNIRRQTAEAGTDFQIFSDIADMPDITCKACGKKTFINAVQVKKVPGLANSTGQDQYIPRPVLVCAANDCGEVMDGNN